MKKNIFALFTIFILVIIGIIIIKASDKNQPEQDINKFNKKVMQTEENSQNQKDLSNNTKPEITNAVEQVIEPGKIYLVTLKTTAGEIVIEMDSNSTPVTINNFIFLAKKGFYDNTTFHRAIKGFMVQGGDPKGDGTGGPGYRFDDEPFTGEYTRGTMAMANAGPNTNGSQFFIMHQDYQLSLNYVIFGHVVKGLEIIDKIAEAEVELSASGEMSKPVDPIVINSVFYVEKELVTDDLGTSGEVEE